MTIIQSLVVFKIGYFEIMVVIKYDVHKSKLSIIKINKLLFIYSGFLEQQNIEFIEKKKSESSLCKVGFTLKVRVYYW